MIFFSSLVDYRAYIDSVKKKKKKKNAKSKIHISRKISENTLIIQIDHADLFEKGGGFDERLKLFWKRVQRS